MWVRLRAEGLPGGAAVSPLPRELLITIALRDVIAPAILLGAFVGVLLWMIHNTGVRRRLQSATSWRNVRANPGASTARIALLLLVPALLLAGGAYAPWEARNFTPLVAWLLALSVVIPVALIAAARAEGRQTSLSVLAVAAFALFVGIVALGARVLIDVWNPELEHAKVCVSDGGEDREGHLIGQTSSAVYIGIEGRRQIVVVPATRVREVLIGERLLACPSSTVKTGGR